MQSWQSPHGRPLPQAGTRTLVMGILNVTPDSFSDGGQLASTQAIVDRAGAMLAAGADLLDVGGESTRPGAAAVSTDAELARVLPAIAALRSAFPTAPLSIDTYKSDVADAAVRAGADVINDVWGGLHGIDAATRTAWLRGLAGASGLQPAATPMTRVAAARGCPLILMHHRLDRNYADFWSDVVADLKLSVAVARAAGVATEQLWLDPGFGFVKSVAQNLAVVRDLRRIVALGFPVLIGTSRKSTLGAVLGTTVDDRLEAGGASLVWAIHEGASMVRVHDVAEMVRFVRTADAIKSGLAFTPR